MLAQGVRQSIAQNKAGFHLLVAVGIGLVLGVVCLMFSPILALGALAVGGLSIAMLKRPELALLGILTATSSFIFENRLPIFSIGIGSLHVTDVLLLAMLLLIGLRSLVEPGFKIVRTPLDWPLMAFYVAALLSTFLAVIQGGVEVEEARRAIRAVTYYLTFFIVTNLIREERQLRLLLQGMLLLASVVAAAMIAQFFAGEATQFLPGRVEALKASGEIFSSTARIIPPGRSLLLVSFVALSAVFSMRKLRSANIFAIIQWLVLGLAITLTFLRSYWVVAGIALLLLGYLSNWKGKRRLIGLGLIVILLVAVILLSSLGRLESEAAEFARGAFARLSTLGTSKTLDESSLQMRYVENEYALRQIRSHPLLGLGMGAKYRPFDPRIDRPGEAWDARAFIHNGHLWVLLTTGLLGYLCLMWLSVAFLSRGFRYWRRISDSQMRGVVLGFTLAYLGIIIAASVNRVFGSWIWTPIIGIMMGVNEVAFRKARKMG